MAGFTLPLGPQAAQDFLAQALKPGACFVYPTETFYALGCRADQAEAVEQIFDLKGRQRDQPLLVLVSGLKMLKLYCPQLSTRQEAFLEQHWPGPLSAILPSQGLAPELNPQGSTVAFRHSGHVEISGLIEQSGVPWVGTSANASGAPPATELSQALAPWGPQVSWWIDGGKTPGGLPSTVVDLSSPAGYRVLRPGALALPAKGAI